MKRIAFLAASLLVAAPAHAALIGDVDMASQNFSVSSYSGTGTALGTSNGIGWSMAGGGIYTLFTDNNIYELGVGDYTYFSPHVSGDWTITFDSAITSLLLLVENDNSGDSGVDFGFAASDKEDVATSGTAYRVGTAAGFLLYEFAAPILSISNTYPGVNDGYDMAFFANAVPVSTVPLPAGGVLLLTGIAGLAAMRRLRKA